ncbi:phospho-sugar mutase [Christensenellaceae bacterium OttesenSCG-928-L17]|nr:phospho-sugar mutase [Christensenellaceae bacterium OttesenSCG-928-L17]
MNYQEVFNDWMRFSDSATQDELRGLPEQEREERFYTELSFGTAGLRGMIGAGTNRMNKYVVRRATQGLCDFLLAQAAENAQRGVVIAYDSRCCSDEFAMETALTCAKNGVHAYLFDGIRAVPQLSFAVRHLHCIAGVVITASHNPAAYNGYKVYWEHGGQIAPAQADAVLEAIGRIDYFGVVPMELDAALRSGLVTMIGTDVDEAYYAATQTLLLHPEVLAAHGADLNIVYTPLHGAGNVPVREILKRAGVSNVHVVKEQELPNGLFPTVAAPNPEDPNAFYLAEVLANQTGANTLLATDPDSDRLGVAVRLPNGTFATLTGNQIGCLLIEYILSSLQEKNALPKNALVVKSIVSTRLADAICAQYGVEIQDVLTGFRFISEIIDTAEKTQSHQFIFGFEESYGFLAGGFSRDKDAICAAMLIAEMCVVYALSGMTLYDALEKIYQKYGYYKEGICNYVLEGKAGVERIQGAMQTLRNSPPPALAGVRVLVVEDYKAGIKTRAGGAQEPLLLPKTDMLRFVLENDAWIAVRPSGTEPKLKMYVAVTAKKEESANILCDTILQQMDQLLNDVLGLPA